MQGVEVRVEVVAGRHRERVPEVVGVVALVVVRHARMLRDRGRGGVDRVGIDTRGHERRAVTQRAQVSKMADSWRSTPVSLHLLDACAHVGLGEAEPFTECGEGPGDDGKVPLERVQQLPIDVVELAVVLRDRHHRHARAR